MNKAFVVLLALIVPSVTGIIPVSAGEVTVKNCTESQLAIYSFEEKDRGCEHEVDEVDLATSEAGQLVCEKGNSCQAALDFVGGQWVYFKCPDIETKLITEEELLVVCSEKKNSKGFKVAERYKVVSLSEEENSCETLCQGVK